MAETLVFNGECDIECLLYGLDECPASVLFFACLKANFILRQVRASPRMQRANACRHATHLKSSRLSVCYLYVFPVSSSVIRLLTGAFHLRASSATAFTSTQAVFPVTVRWLERRRRRSCYSCDSLLRWEALLQIWWVFIIASRRCLFVWVLDTFDVQVAPDNLLVVFIFLIEHTERIIRRDRCGFATFRFFLLRALLAIPFFHHTLLDFLFKSVPHLFQLCLNLSFLNRHKWIRGVSKW